MQRSTISLAVSACLVALLGAAEPASAAFTTFASGNGNDSNDCATPGTACRQITTAITKTDPGGTVAVLPDDYNPSSVGEAGKQVDIIGQGEVATITGSVLPDPRGGTLNVAVIVNVNAAGTMPIKIHGLTIAAGGGGILILGNSPEVDIRNCVITSAGPTYGIDFQPGQDGKLFVSDTLVSRAVGSSSGGAVRIRPIDAGSDVMFDNALLQNNIAGITVDGTATAGSNSVSIRNSVVSGGAGVGIKASDSGGGTTSVLVDGSTVSNNGGNGIAAGGSNATVRVGN
jgi:hypothetical protein